MQNKRPAFPKKPLVSLAVAVFWVAVWQGVYLLIGNDLLIASPKMTLQRVLQLAATSVFWQCCANSVGHILMGFALAFLAAVVLSVLSAVLPVLGRLLSPIMHLIRATPVASFIVLALLWLKTGLSAFIAFLMVLPILYGNLSEGFSSVDRSLLEMAAVYRMPFFRKLRLIYLPALLPHLVSACSTGLGFCWKAGIAAEVIGLPGRTLGSEIYNAKVYLETTDLFALTAVIILFSVLLEKLFLYLLRRTTDRIVKGGEPSC